MGITTTFYAIERAIAEQITDGDLNFPGDRDCAVDKSWEGLKHFAGLGPDAPHQLIEIGGGEIALYTTEQIVRLRNGLQSETFRATLDGTPDDVFAHQKLYPFNPGDTLTDARDYLSVHAEKLCRFLADASDENLAIVSVQI